MKRSNEFLQIESDDEQELHSQVPTSHRVSSSSAPAAVERTRPVNNRRIVTEEVIESHIPYISDDTVQWDIAKFKKPTDKELNYWNQLSNELKNQFLKSIIRFFLMKGMLFPFITVMYLKIIYYIASKNENISRSHIIDTLKPIGNEYRQVTNAILYNAQEKLYNVFGYIVCQSKRILLNHNGKNDEYFLSNAIKSPKLQSIIHNQHENTKAFRAFVFLVCQFIYVSPGKSIDAASLLKHLNMLDSRFPVTILIDDKKQNKNKATAPIPELDDNFLGLMNRMKRQGFVTSPKEDETEPGRVKYELGPRFYNDVSYNRHSLQLYLIYSIYTLVGCASISQSTFCN